MIETTFQIPNLPKDSKDLMMPWQSDHSNRKINLDEVKKIDKSLEELKNFSKNEGSPALVTVHLSEDVWMTLINEFGLDIPMPLVSANVEGEVLFSFNTPNKYLGIRAFENLTIEIFYKDFENNLRNFEENLNVEDIIKSDQVRDFFIH